jgi:putative transposase
MNRHSNEFRVTTMARVFVVSTSGYYQWKSNRSKVSKSSQLDVMVHTNFMENKSRYGYRRVQESLILKGFKRNAKTIRKSMCRQNLRARIRRRYVKTTDSNHCMPVYGNVLGRDFTASQKNQKWVGDITYLRTSSGWIYLSVFIDLLTRKVVGWAMSEKIDADLACRSLEEALIREGNPRGVIVHTDRGSTYCSHQYRNLLAQNELQGSMSRKGNCWDNAVAESFFSSLKSELKESDKFENPEEAYRLIFEYIEIWYNQQRLHSALGYLSPAEYEKRASLSNQLVRF